MANAIAVDNNGAAYVTGWTISTNFPNTVGTNMLGLHSFVATNTSLSFLATNVFLTKITNAIGTTNVGIAWSAVFGGKGTDIGYGVALDPAGSNVFVTGSASSTNFPTFNVPGYLRPTNSGKSDAFVIAFNATGHRTCSIPPTSAARNNDYGYGIAVDANGDAYVVGQTLSTNFPTLTADYPVRNGTNDAFLTKIMLTVPPPTITSRPISQTMAVGSTVNSAVRRDRGRRLTFFNGRRRDELGDTWTNLVDGTREYQRRNQQPHLVINHAQINQQRILLPGHRHELRRSGDQFHRALDGDECPARGLPCSRQARRTGWERLRSWLSP